MRAITMTDHDTKPALAEVPIPEPGNDEVQVHIRAAAVNGFDLAVAAGLTKDYMEHRFPLVLGKDYAGEVSAIGSGVTGFAVGDRVFGTVTKPYLGDGSFADYVVVPTSVGIAKLPDDVSFTDGAALGLAGAAAHGAMSGTSLEAGQTMLVVGATGGVGNQVVQLAKAAGARVIATANTDEERDLVTRLGSDETVNHTADLTAQVRSIAPEGVDVLVHLAGPFDVVELVRPGGRFVSTLLASAEQVTTDTATVIPVQANPTPDDLGRSAASLARGETVVHIQQVYSLEQVNDAFDQFARGTLGKLVIAID
jgi:NADPH:quinone reductase-like Zn-dependent oxidoreductase